MSGFFSRIGGGIMNFFNGARNIFSRITGGIRNTIQNIVNKFREKASPIIGEDTVDNLIQNMGDKLSYAKNNMLNNLQ